LLDYDTPARSLHHHAARSMTYFHSAVPALCFAVVGSVTYTIVPDGAGPAMLPRGNDQFGWQLAIVAVHISYALNAQCGRSDLEVGT